MSNSELLLILLFQEKTSTSPDDSADLSNVRAVHDLIDVHEDLIDVQGTPGDLIQGAMANAVTSTPLSSQTVIPVSDLDQDQNGTMRVTRARSYLSALPIS